MLGGADALKMVRFAAFAADSLTAPYEPRRRLMKRKGELLAAAAAGTVVIAGSSYWIGMRSVRAGATVDRAVVASDGSRPMHVPKPIVTKLAPVATPGNRFILQPDDKLQTADSVAVRDPVQAPPANDDLNSGRNVSVKAAEAAAPRKSSDSDPRSAAPKVQAVSDQMVRIGRFATQSDAESGWAMVLHKWPGMHSLSVVPVPIKSLRDGNTYYRLQVGTTSRAHSEVVCQRAHDLDQSCTVIGADENSGESSL